ncbi:MAG: phosphate ABC transporter substrate-binding protein [Candidatus Hadarchaeum sp.]|uniref:phosphate ABC transporter substrate-binding protein n=1 Tax=Candidatus Hadarchaeum sp. TaxID=2883567 RepID=UPI003D098EE8
MKSKTIVYLGLLIVAVIAASAIILQGTKSQLSPTQGTAAQTQTTRSIKVKGSTTVLPIAQAAAEAWMDAHPNDKITVEGGGSGVGIAALIDGTCDIANSSRTLKDEEKSAGLVEHRIALDAVCVIVNSTNPVNELTLEQLKAIFKGDITNWSEVGGPNLEIVVYTRESTSGTYETFETKVMKPENITLRALTKTSNGEMAQAISGNPNGIGYVGIGYLADASGIKALKINGIEPSVSTVQSGAYPISRYLFMITKGQPEGLAKEFIDFVTGPSGQKIVEEHGFVKLP